MRSRRRAGDTRTPTCPTSPGRASTSASSWCDQVASRTRPPAIVDARRSAQRSGLRPAVDPLSVQTVAGNGCVQADWISRRPASRSSSSSCMTAMPSSTKAVPRGLDGAAQAGRRHRWRRRQRRRFLQQGEHRGHAHGRVRQAAGPVLELLAQLPADRSAASRSRSLVKGTLPLEADFSEWGLGDT